MIIERSLTYFGNDDNSPAPGTGGEDFFSPTLMEADLNAARAKTSGVSPLV